MVKHARDIILQLMDLTLDPLGRSWDPPLHDTAVSPVQALLALLVVLDLVDGALLVALAAVRNIIV